MMRKHHGERWSSIAAIITDHHFLLILLLVLATLFLRAYCEEGERELELVFYPLFMHILS